MKHIAFVLFLLWNASLCIQGHLLSQPDLELYHIQAQEQLISNHNDSLYVQRVMRLAKASEMRNYMDEKVDACDNFYELSCGNWPKIHPANDAHPRETNYEQLLVKAYRHKQQRLLERPANLKIDDSGVFKVKQFYASCLHYRQTPTALYRQQLAEIIGEFGRMPALALPGQEWPADEFDWLETVALIKRKYDLNIILLLQMIDDKIYVGQPHRFSPQPNQQGRELVNQITKQLEQHLNLAEDVAKETAMEIAELEEKLVKAMVDRPVGVLAQLRTADELDAAYSNEVNLTTYLENVLERPVDSNETFYQHVPSYLSHVLPILTETPTNVLANYIFHQLVMHFNYDLQSSSAVKQCLASVREHFPELLDYMVYQHYGDAATLEDIESVWQQVKGSFSEMLESKNSDWLAVLTRRQLLEQLNATRLVINGHANVNFSEKYQLLHFKNQDYLFNLRSILSHDRFKNKPTNQLSSPTYDAKSNAVLLPVALIQPNILWSRYYPRALRYGSIGTLLAQPLAHSFNDHSGWDSSSQEEYEKRKDCFKYQYGRLRLDGQYLAENEMQAQNMADNVAVQVAYLAYKSYLQQLAKSAIGTESLPTLNGTPQQLFFFSYGQLWCSDANEQFRDKQSLLNTRTPNPLRLLGSLANFADFANDFKCPRETRMNPSQKCQLY
ncbi:neprilysin-4 [Drosophila willistoni]|uniref:neprilysin-4 n=1 Tax=Drosophila willistoni TaxID=7260 RepID=UPI00017D907C|nr:neprilysin-4 [Drosophila willistoni]